MTPFVNPEFWLSVSFLIIVGLIVFPPIRQRIRNFFLHQRHKVEKDIQNAQDVYQEALKAHQAIVKELKVKPNDKKFPQQIKELQKEWDKKIENQLQMKKQDFGMRQNLMELQIKNHLREELLQQVEAKIDSHQKKGISEKEVAHFIKMLNDNEAILKRSF